MDNEIIIGIDGGNAGAIVGLQGKKVLFKMVMPIVAVGDSKNEYDCNAIVELFKQYPDATVILEKAHAMPLMGVASMFNFGKSFGMMIGILTALHIRHHIVHPKTWQKALFKDQAHGDTKKASKIIAQRLFPGESFLATARSTKVHDGLTDAILLAYYGQHYIHAI